MLSPAVADATVQYSSPVVLPHGRQCPCASELVFLALLATQNPDSDHPTGRVSPVYHSPPLVGQLLSLALYLSCVLHITDLNAPLHKDQWGQ